MKYEEIIDKSLEEFFWDIVNFRSSHLREKNKEYKDVTLEQIQRYYQEGNE